ncbi:disulfide bond formation protein B [Limimaricola sp. AA108-03]|uniref:disulfide bond formation protein B n=1 Tax=Limimaricola sp. AA108-03 TaxID=3425945 RepID=UPI003D772B66
MSRTLTILLATLGSAALLGGAFIFQAFGYPPCAMCIWQRWPHGIAIAIGLIALMLPGRVLPLLGALAAVTTAAIGVFHTGVERDWWEGPASCTGTGQSLGSLSGGDLLSMDGPRLVMCDVVSWELFGLSMASWNALFSLVLVGLWVTALRRS